MKKIILASSSPRRKEIFKKMGIEFDIIPSSYEEVLINDEFSYEKVENLALNKALDVLNKLSPKDFSGYSFILSADTVVVINDKILGKPESKDSAVSMLQTLSGQTHSVITSICLINLKTQIKKVLSETSYVEFNVLSENIILDYINKYKPFDKAGAYGIQELPEGFIKNIEGSFENIVGLCPDVVKKIFNSFSIEL